jgi:DNA-binding winged helix-turn-helix (wHTH) protein/predicted ATPase
MPETRTWYFAPFHVDLGAERLWQGTEPVRLTAKAFAVLCYLVEHAGQLVTKDDLFAAVWESAYVSEAALAVCIGEIRRALGDVAQTRQYLETVRGRGYRFVAPITAPPAAPEPVVAVTRPGPLVGQEVAWAELQQRWVQARQGVRQVVFVTGEAGIGKTTLVDAFAAHVATGRVWDGRGQCIEQHGVGEAYLPLLEALGRLGRAPGGDRLIALLHQQAPSWLVHLPAFVPPETSEMLQRRAGGTTRERMLRELAEAVEVLTVEQPLVLVLEDLHWSDGATLDWLAYVARRREAARLLVLGTYRPVEAIVRAHPVRAMVHELIVHGCGTELALQEWSEAGVAAYLAQRGAGAHVPAALARVLTQRTDGHPLFVVALVDELLRQQVLRVEPTGWVLAAGRDAGTVGVPPSIRHLLEQQVARLCPADQALLAAASVAGVEFAVAAVAAGLQETGEAVEVQCDTLARQHQLVQARGTVVWPDGTVTARYGFRHALYQELLYDWVPVSRRVRWHQQIGMRLEAAFGPRADEIAAELAVHFAHGHDAERAVRYLQRAAATAVQRHAHREAIAYLRQALALLQGLAETPQRCRYELAVQLALGPALMVTRGFGAPEVGDTYARARQLCEQLGDRQQLFPALFGLWRSAHVRGQLQTARALGEQLLGLANAQADPLLFVEAQGPLGQTLCMQGELTLAQEHLQRVVALYEPHWHRPLVVRCAYDPGVYAHVMEAWVLWVRGYPTQGLRRSQAALCLARQQAHPFTLALTLVTIVIMQHMCREGESTLKHVQASLALSTEYEFPYLTMLGTVLQGWELTRMAQVAEGLTQMRQGLAALRVMGAEILRPSMLALLADACARDGQVEAALDVLKEALVTAETHTERFYAAELHRLQGELVLRQCQEAGAKPAPRDIQQTASGETTGRISLPIEAEVCFHRALDVARFQQAKSLELRAATSLGHLWQQQGKRQEAYDLLAPIYGWFTEGFDTADLQEARALLDALA